MPDWSLEDVEAAAGAAPRSFFIPDRAERCRQGIGSEVRLHFLLEGEGPDLPRAERMWVDIVERTGDPPRYVGELANEPRYIRDLALGDRVEFGPEHIAQTIIGRTDPRWFEAAEQKAIVSGQVFEEGEGVCWMYREPAARDEDSGWRLFTGHETHEYLDDPSNARICNVSWLLDFDPSLQPAIRAQPGKAFERASLSAPWVEVVDWRAPEG